MANNENKDTTPISNRDNLGEFLEEFTQAVATEMEHQEKVFVATVQEKLRSLVGELIAEASKEFLNKRPKISRK